LGDQDLDREKKNSEGQDEKGDLAVKAQIGQD
jgi:hypothetical protein